MAISEKYISQAEYDAEITKDLNFKTTKIVISNEACAICETIENKLEHLRLSLMK